MNPLPSEDQKVSNENKMDRKKNPKNPKIPKRLTAQSRRYLAPRSEIKESQEARIFTFVSLNCNRGQLGPIHNRREESLICPGCLQE